MRGKLVVLVANGRCSLLRGRLVVGRRGDCFSVERSDGIASWGDLGDVSVVRHVVG